jgi:hypothetical protein
MARGGRSEQEEIYIPFVQLPRRPQLTPAAEEAIPSDGNGNGIPLLLAWIARWVCPQ